MRDFSVLLCVENTDTGGLRQEYKSYENKRGAMRRVLGQTHGDDRVNACARIHVETRDRLPQWLSREGDARGNWV